MECYVTHWPCGAIPSFVFLMDFLKKELSEIKALEKQIHITYLS